MTDDAYTRTAPTLDRLYTTLAEHLPELSDGRSTPRRREAQAETLIALTAALAEAFNLGRQSHHP